MADHFFCDRDRDVVLAVVDKELEPASLVRSHWHDIPDKVGQDRAAPRVRADRRVVLQRLLQVGEGHEKGACQVSLLSCTEAKGCLSAIRTLPRRPRKLHSRAQHGATKSVDGCSPAKIENCLYTTLQFALQQRIASRP